MEPKVSLRPVADDDLDEIFEQMRDPISVGMAAFTSADPGDRAAFDARMARLRASQDVRLLAVVADGDLAGTIASFRQEDDTEITYWIGRRWWGRGVASAALAAFLAVTPERPLQARVASDNLGSIRVLEKNGFQAAGADRGFASGRNSEMDERIYIHP